MGTPKTPEQFIEGSRSAHGDKYDYTRVVYVNRHTEVEIGCQKHGWFQQKPASHLVGRGCQKCGLESMSLSKRSDAKSFVEQATARHGNKYDYTRVVYTDGRTEVEIGCSSHGFFWQTPSNHINSQVGCTQCVLEAKRGVTSASWKGHGELSKDHWTVIKWNAAKRGIEHSITIEYAWNLFLGQDRKCSITGCPLVMHIPSNKSGRKKKKKPMWTASLDRIDSSKGYVVGNVQWVHVDINLMKLHHSTQRFYELCYAVVHYRQQQQSMPMSAGN